MVGYIPTPCVTISSTDTSKSEDVEKRLAEMERTHSAKLTLLQQTLQEETERRWSILDILIDAIYMYVSIVSIIYCIYTYMYEREFDSLFCCMYCTCPCLSYTAF